MKNSTLSLFVFVFLIFSCGTKDVISPIDYDGDRIIFTHGGGFAGTYKSYCLLENGQLFKGTEQYVANQPTTSLKRDIANQIFSNYKVLGLDEKKVESYGNLNYSIMMIRKDGTQHKLIWGKDQEGAEILQVFYNNFMNQVRLNNSDNTIIKASKK